MPKEVFDELCRRTTKAIGKEVFRSEEYLFETESHHSDAKTVPSIPGEIKMAVCLRMMAGGSYLDLVPLFGVSTLYLYTVFTQFLEWVTATFEFPFVKWLREGRWDALLQSADAFAEKSNGVFYGPVAALDGLAVRAQCPSLKEVTDPGNYYCRKGFYALNVQAMCNKRKIFLWSNPTNKGSCHDQTAWTGTR